MKKTSAIIMAACLCIGSLTGCEKTPEEVIVKQKGADNIKEYKGEEKVRGALAERLGVPEHYTNEASYEDGKLVIDTDAEIILPEADSMDTIAVSAKEVNQELIDTVTKAFFEGDKIYDYDAYHVTTKAFLQEKITELKKYKAEGNLDPYDIGSDEEGNLYFDIDAEIEMCEEEYQTAPEVPIKEEVTPQFGISGNEDNFSGAVETENGTYSYLVSYALAPDITFKINKNRDGESGSRGYPMWMETEFIMDEEGENQMSEEEVKGYVDISYEDALKTAQEKVDKLGWGLEVCDWDYALYYQGNGYTKDSILDGGYIFHFARKIDGAFITNTLDYGGALEDMDSTLEPWSYERCDIIVGDDGIQKVEIYNPYDIGEVQTENVKLMDFDSIIKIYEQMMEVSNADITADGEERTYHIRKIKLGYTRIYDPATDNDTGLLVPVWDFFGGFDCVDDDYIRNNSGEHSTQSFLTINAIDGTVINRGLGY